MVFNDTEEILELFKELLTGEGYRVTLHGYGTRDLDNVRHGKPDLIIADCAPLDREVQGWQLIQKLKMSRETDHIPIVLCSTNLKALRETEGWLPSKGIVAIPKPFTLDELRDAVELQIGRAGDETNADLASAASNATAEDIPAGTASEDENPD